MFSNKVNKREFLQRNVSMLSRGGRIREHNQNKFKEPEPHQKELSPFEGQSHLKKFYTLIAAFERASKSEKAPPSAKSLFEISNVVCKIIFTTPVTNMQDVENCCRSIAQRSSLKKCKDLTETVITVFTKKLSERFMYKNSLQNLLKGRQIPLEKKQKWLQYQYEVQGKQLMLTDVRSIYLLVQTFLYSPEFVYPVIETLLRLNSGEDNLYKYLDALLKSIRPGLKIRISYRSNKELLERFQAIKQFAEESDSVPPTTKALLTEHWNDRFAETGGLLKDNTHVK